MKEVEIKQLASDVAAILGESLALDCSPEESPFPDLQLRVRILAPEALNKLIWDTPLCRLSDAKAFQGTVKRDENGDGKLELPEDFFRLVSVRMSDWKYPVTEIAESGQTEIQSSRWPGVKGNPERPAVTLEMVAPGKRVMHLYSSDADATLSSFLYIPRPEVSAAGILSLPSDLYSPLVVWLANYFSGLIRE